MSFEKNLEYARLAHELGVDVLEAGFPSASKLDFEIVEAIARELGPLQDSPVIAGLCQLRREQVESTIEALSSAVRYKKARLHTYLPVDPELMAASLGPAANDKAALIRQVHDFCKMAADAGLEVEFSPEGYSRVGENFDFTSDLLRAAIEAGARVLNCPDTIGGASQYQGENYFVRLMQKHADLMAQEYPGIELTWSAHCHNDFGLAAVNTVNAVFEGPARQIEGCFNGIGERAGNAALEQCIMIIKHFAQGPADERFFTRIKTEKLQEISDFVRLHMLERQPHWPICGDNAAKHSSGGHTNAIIRNPLAYQPFDPRETGQEISLLFGPLSGGNHAQSIIQRYGYRCSEEEKTDLSQYIKDRYKERRKGITDKELLQAYFEYRAPIKVRSIDYSRSKNLSEVQIEGKFFEREGTICESYQGEDSALTTLKQLIDAVYPGTEIQNYHSESIGSGTHAISLSKIMLSDNGSRLYEGRGEDRDIGKSAMKALIEAVNQAYIERHCKLSR